MTRNPLKTICLYILKDLSILGGVGCGHNFRHNQHLITTSRLQVLKIRVVYGMMSWPVEPSYKIS